MEKWTSNPRLSRITNVNHIKITVTSQVGVIT